MTNVLRDEVSTVPCDGAMGTTLLADGALRPGVPADACVDGAPHAIASVHRRFVAAGARVLRTATLCTRPRDPASERRMTTAIALARAAGPAEVWLSIGPTGGADAACLPRVAGLPVDRILFETFTDPDELLDAVRRVRASTDRPIVASMAAGRPIPVRALRRGGADVVGVNCGRTPSDAVASFLTHDDGGPWWVAPAGGPGFAAAITALRPRVRWLGGCCGVDPDAWAAACPR